MNQVRRFDPKMNESNIQDYSNLSPVFVTEIRFRESGNMFVYLIMEEELFVLVDAKDGTIKETKCIIGLDWETK